MSVPIYCAIDSPHGSEELNGICFMRDLTLDIISDLDIDESLDEDDRDDLLDLVKADLDAALDFIEDADLEDNDL